MIMLHLQKPHMSERHVVFTKQHRNLGEMAIRPLAPDEDSVILHDWFTRDYARFWNMRHYSRQEIAAFYAKMNASGHAESFMGYFKGEPAFVMESYDPRHDQVGKHYDIQTGDWGMHFLVAPPSIPISGFTLSIIRTILSFHFSDPQIHRLVVEPDVRNTKVHELNRKVGFVSAGHIKLEEKTALLSFVTRDAFNNTLEQEENE